MSTDAGVSEPPTPSLKELFAPVVGNLLEWYDFAVYGYLATSIGLNFFPPADGCGAANITNTEAGNCTDTGALVESFAVFGGTFLMRPIGGVLFGYIGDRYGRAQALSCSIFLMAAPTTALGLLPTWSQIGVGAPVLLVAVRLVQGVSVGGQLVGSMVMTTERAPPHLRCWRSSIVLSSACFGTLLGAFVGTMMHVIFSEDALHHWAWRLPFLSGSIVAFVGCYVRRSMRDTDDVVAARQRGASAGDPPANPTCVALCTECSRILAATCIAGLWCAGFYTYFMWTPTFTTELVEPREHRLGPAQGRAASLSVMVAFCAMILACGAAVDRLGARRHAIFRSMLVGALLLTFLSPLAMVAMGSGSLAAAVGGQLLAAAPLAMLAAPLSVFMVLSFKSSVRYTALGPCARALA